MERKFHSDTTLDTWLTEFKKETTRATYRNALVNFKNIVGIRDLGEYVKNGPDVTLDVRKFLAAYDGKPSKTVATYAGAVKTFLQDHKVKVPDEEWTKIRRRGFLPKRVKAETEDKKNSKQQLRQILNYADIKCRGLVLFLESSGARIGESLQIKDQDLQLDADPPRAKIRAEYTKAGVGERTVYFSYEARDAIKDWLRVRDTTAKHSGGTYKSDRVFPFDEGTARFMWNLAIKKANLNILDARTRRRIYHLHGLRKFFRSNINLDDKIVHALMGHVEYLDDAYLRLEQEGEIAKAYLEAMPNVSVFTVEDQRLAEQTSDLKKENEALKQRIATLETVQSENLDLKKRISKTEEKLGEIETILKQMVEDSNS